MSNTLKTKLNIVLKFFLQNLEGFIWLFALLSLAFTYHTEEHYSFCVFNNLGFKYCPGCGVGHAISYFFHGEFAKSISTHPFGVVAIIILSHRIFTIFLNKNKTQYELNT